MQQLQKGAMSEFKEILLVHIFVLHKDIGLEGGSENCNFLLLYLLQISLKPFNNYVDMEWGGQKKSVFVHSQGTKSLHAGGGGEVKKWKNDPLRVLT